jgi:hypothetical protein
MIRYIKRYFAIRSYVLRLSQELVSRFDKRSSYSVEQVTQAVERAGLSKACIAYAHAAYCEQPDFEAYYPPLKVKCNYQDLRRTISRRFLAGRLDFDAKTIIDRYRREKSGPFSESGIGLSGGP